MKDKTHNEINTDKHKDQQNEMQKKKDNEKTAVTKYCMGCKNEIFPVFHCSCAGGPASDGGGPTSGGGASEGKSEMKSGGAITSASQTTNQSNPQSAGPRINGKNWGDIVKPALTPRETMLAVISNLLDKKLLTIEDNKGLCTLSIKCDPKLLSEPQRTAVKEFVKTIQKELDDFKIKNGMSDKDCHVKTEKDKQGNIVSLTINIPNPKLYAAFIKQLSDKNILQLFGSEQKARDTKDKAALFNPTPLKTKPTPPGWKE